MAKISQRKSIRTNIIHFVHALPIVSKLLDHQNAIFSLVILHFYYFFQHISLKELSEHCPLQDNQFFTDTLNTDYGVHIANGSTNTSSYLTFFLL